MRGFFRFIMGARVIKATGSELKQHYESGHVVYAVQNDQGDIVGAEWGDSFQRQYGAGKRYDKVIGGCTDFWRVRDREDWRDTPEHDNSEMYEFVF